MSQAVVVRCPGCLRELRVPPEMIDKKIRCKFCSTAFETHKKTRQPIARPTGHHANGVEELVELEPIAEPPANHAPRAASQAMPSRADQSISGYTGGQYESAFHVADKYAGKKYRGPTKGNTLTWVVVGLAGLVMSALVAVVLLKPDLFGKKNGGEEKELVENGGNSGNNNPGDSPTGEGEKPKVENPKGENPPPKPVPKTTPKGGAFPRRLLSINVSNYLFLNPLHYGGSSGGKDRRDTHGSVMKLVNAWKVPSDQFYELTDGATADEGMKSLPPVERFPMKPNVMKTIELFCETSRPQDRIIFLFSGHAYEKDGKAYLVPIEGEFENVESLIPLEQVYAAFGACKAQEKLVIWDVCRFNPDRGTERPSFGRMTEGLEKALHSQPEGVQVWTSCSKGEYAFEFDHARGPRGEITGSVFLSQFLFASSMGVLNKTGKRGAGGISSPSDPLSYLPTLEWVNDEVVAFVPAVAKGERQTPKFTGSDPPPVEYDPKEALAAKFEIPKIRQGADPKEIASVFAELKLPPMKALRKDAEVPQYDAAFPFSAEVMKKYKADAVTADLIQKNPTKYPFRAAVLDAYEGIRDLAGKSKDADFPDEERSPITDAEKRRILNLQREPAKRQATLRNLKESLEALAPMKAKEPPRWQAHYDYVLAQVKLRYAYLSEYDLALGKVRQEALPALDGKAGWKLASVEKMKAPKDIRDMAEEARVALGELITAHPNTPWALAAKREKGFSLGLEWQPSSFGRDDKK